MLNFIVSMILTTGLDTWTLTSNQTSTPTYEQHVGTITGPKTVHGDDTEGRTVLLGKGVSQEKGDEDWDVTWASDLASPYFYIDEVPFYYGKGFDGEDMIITVQPGTTHDITAFITTNIHSQHWHGVANGTAIRTGKWDSQTGSRMTKL